jgi:hypothetical protein
LDARWTPLVDALVFLFEDPKGPIFISALDGDDNQKHFVVSPPPSLKAFRESSNPEELLNAGIPGDGVLSKRYKHRPSKVQLLKDLGWVRPQHPFNSYFSLGSPNGRSVAQLLEYSVDSYAQVFDVEPTELFRISLATVDAEAIHGRFLDYIPEHDAWRLREVDSSSKTSEGESFDDIDLDEIAFDEVEFEDSEDAVKLEVEILPPELKLEPVTQPETQAPSSAGQALRDADGIEVHVGAKVKFTVANDGAAVTIQGTLLGESNGAALIEVSNSLVIPKNDYAIPWNIVRIAN